MQRQTVKPKTHPATVTGRDPDHVGSITLDPELMRSADVMPNEQERDLRSYAPTVVHVGGRNETVRVDSHPEVLLDSPLASEAGLETQGNPISEGGGR